MTEAAPPENQQTYTSSGVLDSKNNDGTACTISGKPFSVAGWVKPYIDVIEPNTPVNYSYRALRGETMVTKIQAVKTSSKAAPKATKKPAEHVPSQSTGSTGFKTGNEIKKEAPTAPPAANSTGPESKPAEVKGSVEPVATSQGHSSPTTNKDPNKVLIEPAESAATSQGHICQCSKNQISDYHPEGAVTRVVLEAKVNLENFENFGVTVEGTNYGIAEWALRDALAHQMEVSTGPTKDKFRAYIKRVFGE